MTEPIVTEPIETTSSGRRGGLIAVVLVVVALSLALWWLKGRSA